MAAVSSMTLFEAWLAEPVMVFLLPSVPVISTAHPPQPGLLRDDPSA